MKVCMDITCAVQIQADMRLQFQIALICFWHMLPSVTAKPVKVQHSCW